MTTARRRILPDVRRAGLAGRPEVGRLRVYASEHAHSSIDKAVILLGLGHDALRHIASDHEFRMRAAALQSAITEDRSAGIRPVAVVGTIGTTSTTSVDPIRDIAGVCEREGLWLHVDAAYAGVTAMIPECRARFEGWERADSIVVNPHKWLFTPFDLSAFYCRRMDVVRAAFTLVPEFLRTAEGERGVRNLMDTGIQLGRRFRSLKLWMILRHFGAERLRQTLAGHMLLARQFAAWVDADPDFERLAPAPFSVVCFRARPRNVSLAHAQLDRLNEALLTAVNSSGEVFLSHTRVNDVIALRLAIGHLRTTEQHVARAWQLLREHADQLVRSI